MSIADLKTRLPDVPGIESLTMVMEAGRQNYNLNGRVITVDAAASDFQVEQAIRAAVATPATAALQASQALGEHLDASITALTPSAPAATPASLAPALTPASTSASGHPASGAHTVRQVLEEHARAMADLQATQLELLRATLAGQRQTVSGAMGGVVDKIKRQTDDYLAIMGQFTNDLGI